MRAAQVWSTLPQWVLDRTCFIHHATLTNNHANLPKVMRLMGSTARQEMLPSILAKYLAPCFGTVQVDPVSAGAGDILTIDGRDLPNVAPTGLRDVLARPNGAAHAAAGAARPALDKIYGAAQGQGHQGPASCTSTAWCTSRKQARSLGTDLVDMLAGIKSDSADGQVVAAVALIKMNVTPVVTIRIDFGGDNHTDPDLADRGAAARDRHRAHRLAVDPAQGGGPADKVPSPCTTSSAAP